jgi:hypothetical protein
MVNIYFQDEMVTGPFLESCPFVALYFLSSCFFVVPKSCIYDEFQRTTPRWYAGTHRRCKTWEQQRNKMKGSKELRRGKTTAPAAMSSAFPSAGKKNNFTRVSVSCEETNNLLAAAGTHRRCKTWEQQRNKMKGSKELRRGKTRGRAGSPKSCIYDEFQRTTLAFYRPSRNV